MGTRNPVDLEILIAPEILSSTLRLLADCFVEHEVELQLADGLVSGSPR